MIQNVNTKLFSEVTGVIEEKMRVYHDSYDIHPLCWALRGSAANGIIRDNSDLDIIFLFAENDEKVLLIHDITGHDFDIIGWNIVKALQTVAIPKAIKVQTLGEWSKVTPYIGLEYRRTSTDYYNGVFCIPGNRFSGGDAQFIEEFYPLLRRMHCPMMTCGMLLNTTKRLLSEHQKNGKAYLNTYLNAVWAVFMCERIIKGGMPGYVGIAELLTDCDDLCVAESIREMARDYRSSTTKTGIQHYDKAVYSYVDEKYNVLYNYKSGHWTEFDENALLAAYKVAARY